MPYSHGLFCWLTTPHMLRIKDAPITVLDKSDCAPLIYLEFLGDPMRIMLDHEVPQKYPYKPRARWRRNLIKKASNYLNTMQLISSAFVLQNMEEEILQRLVTTFWQV